MSTMVYSDYMKQRIIFFHNEGLKVPSIGTCKTLHAEGISVCRVLVLALLELTGLDLPWNRLLPADTIGQQDEEAGICSFEPALLV